MIENSQLRVFLVAAEEGSFSRAAERLCLSQSAVSQNIQALEQSYGVQLFLRRGRTVMLSEAGQAILPLVREALNASRLVEEALHHANQQVGGELLIGCSTSAGKYLLPILLAEFQLRCPAVLPRVRVMGREAVLDRLINRSLPFGVSSRELLHSSLECVPFFEDRVVLIVPPDHPWASFGRALPTDLIDQPIIVREESSGTREAVIEGLKPHGIYCDMLRVKMELGNAEAIEMAVERGVGIAFVSELVAARGLALGKVKKVEIEGMDLRRTIYIARHVDYPMTRAQATFWEFVLEERKHLKEEYYANLVNFATIG